MKVGNRRNLKDGSWSSRKHKKRGKKKETITVLRQRGGNMNMDFWVCSFPVHCGIPSFRV